MRQKRFLAYLAVQAAVIVAVVFIFKLGSDVKIASVEAGTLFVVMPVVLFLLEARKHQRAPATFYVGLAQFWFFFALPILGVRLLNWDIPFDQLSVLGVPGPALHHFANDSYVLMMLLTLWSFFQRQPALKTQ